MSKKDKIQHLLITYLLEAGAIELNLPDGMKLEVGILKEDKFGDLKKTKDYCWAIVSHQDREISIDKYNLGLRFSDETGNLVSDTVLQSASGERIREVSII